MTPKHLTLLGFVLSASVAALAVASPSPLGALDFRVYDAIVRRAPERAPSGRVAIVAIDDRSLDEIGQWPWARDVVASLVERLHGLGASVVALDAIFAEPDRSASVADAQFARTISSGRVVVGYAFGFTENALSSPTTCLLHPVNAILVQTPGESSPVDRLFNAGSVVCSLPMLARAAQASGYLNVAEDTDGTLRRLPLVMAYQGQVYPSFALAAARAADSESSVSLTAASAYPLALGLGDRNIPLGERATLRLRFRPARRTFPYVSAVDVLKGRVTAAAVKDRVVLVGATATATQDVVVTPVATQFPGIEVHATAVDNLLQRDDIRSLPNARVIVSLATLTTGLVTTAAFVWLGLSWGTVTVLLLVFGSWVTANWAVASMGWFVSPLFPTLSATAAFVALAGVRFGHVTRLAATERRRRQQSQDLMLQTLTSLIEVRDPSTGRHARRTAAYSRLLAQGVAHNPSCAEELTLERIELIATLAPLHDIGKVGIRDALLSKPGALTPEETTEMQRHPTLGFETIANAERRARVDSAQDAAILQVAKDIVYTHHERWDGNGYPRKLAGGEIPIAGRILAVVDVYDALVGPRPYRPALSHQQAVAIIQEGRGNRFDPVVVDAFLAVERDFGDLSPASRTDTRH